MKKTKVRAQPGLPAAKVISSDAADWLATVKTFLATYESVKSNRDLHDIMLTRFYAALVRWAIGKIGVSREQFLRDAFDVFYVWSTLHVTLKKTTIEEAARVAPFNLRRVMSKKRKGVIEQIPEKFSVLIEYEALRRQVVSQRALAYSHGDFRLRLKETLPQPLPVRFEKRLPNYFLKSPTPSQIAADYVGFARGISPSMVKKVVRFAGNGRRVLSTIHKEYKASYLREPQ